LNSEECFSATAIDVLIYKNTHKKEEDQIEGKNMAMLVFNPSLEYPTCPWQAL
jgi:hypothetical protein